MFCLAAPVDLEQVHPSLLLPPHDPAAPQSVLAGGGFEPGDRVVVLRGTGSPPFGSRGTVIGVLPNVIEVLMDQDYAGACAARCKFVIVIRSVTQACEKLDEHLMLMYCLGHPSGFAGAFFAVTPAHCMFQMAQLDDIALHSCN
jgi:hypothetical protein